MNKKITNFLKTILFSFFITWSLLVSSCSNISTEAYVLDSPSAVVSSAMKKFKLSVSANAELFTTKDIGSSRTISPTAYSANDLNFYLGGLIVSTKNSKSDMTVQKVSFIADEDSASSGVVTATLGIYCYELTLIAIPASTDTTTIESETYISDLLDKAVFFGTATADLRYNNGDEVSFRLTSNSLKGKGNISLEFYISDWSEASKKAVDPTSNASVISGAKIGLYDLEGNAVGTVAENQNFTSADSEGSSIKFAKTGISAGTYDIAVIFNYDGKSFVYSDKIVVLPTQTTESILAIPDILQTVPSVPTDFSQGYIIPDNESSDYYKVLFNWTDTSNTETGFEIQLLDVSENPNAITENLNNAEFWNNNSDESNITTYNKNFIGTSAWYAGSLGRNSNAAIIYLPLGKKYYARIRSINNDIGGSSWCYPISGETSLTIPAGSSTAEDANLIHSKTFLSTAFRTPVINLFRISYNLVGGLISPVIDTVYYFDQVASGNPILAPNGKSVNSTYNSEAAVELTKGSLVWNNWGCNSLNGKAYPKSYTQCSSVSDYDSAITYYVTVTQTADVNGNTIGYKKADPQPTEFTETSFPNYYVDSVSLANYIGYKNLSLYAVYESETTPSQDTDYSIKSNMTLSVLADDTSISFTNRTFAFSSTSSSLIINYNYVKNNFSYDYVTLTLFEEGESEIGTYNPSGQTFTLPVSKLKSETDYTIIIKAGKSGATYTTTLLMSVN